MSDNPSREECIMAMIAHASVAIFGPGVLVGVFIWLTQKEKASYASSHGLQAALFQLLGMILTMILWVVWGIFYALSLIPLVRNPEQFETAPPPMFWFWMISWVIPLLFMLAWMLYGLLGALKTLRGRDFRYPLIGNFANK